MTPLLFVAALAVAEAVNGLTAQSPAVADGGITEDDYPPGSLRYQEAGRVGIVFTIDASGSVASCAVDSSSGFDRLDRASCRVVNRMKFKVTPALAAWVGQPRKTGLRWQMAQGVKLRIDGGPEPVPVPSATRGVNVAASDEIPAGRRVNVLVSLNVSETGTVQSCEGSTTPTSEILDRKSCALATKWTYQPVLKDGVAVGFFVKEIVRWAAPDFVAQ